MAAFLNVMYPAEAVNDFDMDYYLKTHMPLVEKTWTPHGLLEWNIIVLNPESGYHVQAILKWESKAALEKAIAIQETTSRVMDDVKKFTSTKPTQMFGAAVASST
jgi:uncharacterized protein (TIGR02118 family)